MVNIEMFGRVPTLQEPVVRHFYNPILRAQDVRQAWKSLVSEHPVMASLTVHNAGAALSWRDQKWVVDLYPRIHVPDGRSVIGYAQSADGIHFNVDARPVLKPATVDDFFAPGVDVARQIQMEAGGVEDMRINDVCTPEGIVRVATYSAYSAKVTDQVFVCLATIGEDGKTFTRLGPISDSIPMRNVVIAPRQINGEYVALVRANGVNAEAIGEEFAEIQIARSPQLSSGWVVEERPIIRTGQGPSPFQSKVGPGAQLIELGDGRILCIFHGARNTMANTPYSLGVAVFEPDMQSVKMCSLPILMPTEADCLVAKSVYVHVPQVVFSCGAVVVPTAWGGDSQDLFLYYGGNDTVMNVGWTRLDVLAELVEKYGQDPLTGKHLYQLP